MIDTIGNVSVGQLLWKNVENDILSTPHDTTSDLRIEHFYGLNKVESVTMASARWYFLNNFLNGTINQIPIYFGYSEFAEGERGWRITLNKIQ